MFKFIKSMLLLFVIGIGGVVLVGALVSGGKRPQGSSALAATGDVAQKASAELQAERQEFIEKMMSEGIVTRLDTDGVPRVYCTPLWRAASIDEKQTLAAVIIGYVYQLPVPMDLEAGQQVVFHDASTGQQFATISEWGYIED